MKICAQYLHCSHEDFQNLPYFERLKWYTFEEYERKAETFWNRKEAEAAKNIKSKNYRN